MRPAAGLSLADLMSLYSKLLSYLPYAEIRSPRDTPLLKELPSQASLLHAQY